MEAKKELVLSLIREVGQFENILGMFLGTDLLSAGERNNLTENFVAQIANFLLNLDENRLKTLLERQTRSNQRYVDDVRRRYSNAPAGADIPELETTDISFEIDAVKKSFNMS